MGHWRFCREGDRTEMGDIAWLEELGTVPPPLGERSMTGSSAALVDLTHLPTPV